MFASRGRIIRGRRGETDLTAHDVVLAATDLTDPADAALRQGHALATARGAAFTVCHVIPEAFNVRVLFPQHAGIDASFQAELEDKARAALRARLRAALGDEDAATVRVETGSAHAGVLEAAERIDAGLIVVAPGATAHRIARAATVPVLVARPSPAGGSVLSATDFSDPSLPAIQAGADEARERRAPFRVVHCLDFDETSYVRTLGLPGMISAWPLPQSVTDDLLASARARLENAIASIGADAEPIVLRRSPAHGIVEAANSVATSLVVVGTRGRTGLTRLALGSVAEAVIDGAPCSVLVVPLHRV